MFKPKLPPYKKVLFSAKPYSASFLNSLFKKLPERPRPFLGALTAEYDQGLLFLFILQSELYSAGGWLEGASKPLTLHEYFQVLAKLDKVQLSLWESDPIYLKCLLGLLQKAPTTQATTDLVSIEGLLERLKQDPGENLLILRKAEEYNFFYFFRKKLVEAYFATMDRKPHEDSLEESLLSYVYTVGASTPVDLLLYSDLNVSGAVDVYSSSTGEGTVDYFLRPCPQLILITPQGTVQRIIIHKGIFTMGRSKENDLMLDDALVSRVHATLRQEEADYILEDEKSRNGVFVNGKTISRVKLSDGDKIQIGGFKLQFLFSDSPPAVSSKTPAVANDETMVRTDMNLMDGRARRQPRCWLEVVIGPLRGCRFEISEVKTVLGRSQADVVLKDPKVSRQHATIEWAEERYRYIDHGSTNGSLVNDQRTTTHILTTGDTIKLGNTELKVTIEVLGKG
jgi:pSer/pThr/pTyr-binding forkhead associated (FHA) protein